MFDVWCASDVLAIISNFQSTIERFDIIYNALDICLENYYKFISDHINFITVDNNNIIKNIIVLNPLIDDVENITCIYKYDLNNINNLLDKLGSNLDRMRDLDNIWSNKIKNNIEYDDCISDFYDRWNSYNNISSTYRSVITYKQITL